jgi:hypothetical protein
MTPPDSNDTEGHSMVQECCDSYHVERHADGGAVITIEASRRFAHLWAVRLSELRATDEDIRDHEP